MEPIGATAATTAPLPPVSRRWISGFALAWLGIWLAQLTPFQLLVPLQVNHLLGIGDTADESTWQRSVVDFGLVSGVSAICALIAFPVAGALSDRTTGRFGRRRPWTVAGSALFAVALLALGVQHTFAGITVCWSLAIIGFCVVSAAVTAMISDQVPHEQRGVVSSWISTPQALGIITGVAVVSVAGLGIVAGYVFLAIALLVLVTPLVLTRGDTPVTVAPRSTESVLDLLRHRDFRWTLSGRVLVNIGNALGTSLLLFFLQFGLRASDPDTALLLMTAIYMAGVIIASPLAGWLSDRIGRRKPFILGSGLLQALSAVLLTTMVNLPAAYVAAALMGAGFGCFMAIDQAVATEVLPDAEHNGKDLGVMNIAMAVPQALAPLIGAGIVHASGGFGALFVVAGLFALGGGVVILQVRGVR
ncbi:MFS transporter [Nocardia stercoris]|uniref:MFS transporter n=1 Tax=Nocardia stercoris TaxID=2483361 RepID=A0A3M2KY64_9NOCA|nr:MFS transporter [Nocardia stercoris]